MKKEIQGRTMRRRFKHRQGHVHQVAIAKTAHVMVRGESFVYDLAAQRTCFMNVSRQRGLTTCNGDKRHLNTVNSGFRRIGLRTLERKSHAYVTPCS